MNLCGTKVLNVAGSRGSKESEISAFTAIALAASE